MAGLAEAIGANGSFTFNGTTYTLGLLEIGDFADAEGHVRSERLRRFLDQTRAVNLPPDVRSGAISEIMTKPIRLDDLLGAADAQLYLLHRSLKNGGAALTLDAMKKFKHSDSVVALQDTVFMLSGLLRPKSEGDDPLEDSTSTTGMKPT